MNKHHCGKSQCHKMTHLHQWGKLFWQTDAAGSEEENECLGIHLFIQVITAAVYTSNKTGNGGIFHVIESKAAQKSNTHPNVSTLVKHRPAKQTREQSKIWTHLAAQTLLRAQIDQEGCYEGNHSIVSMCSSTRECSLTGSQRKP